MKKPLLKIAILSGTLPSTTFIEHLIKGVSQTHDVLLFGVVSQPVIYDSKQVKIYSSPNNRFFNILFTTYRTLYLLVKAPKAMVLLYKEVMRFSTVYDKWVWYSKFLPILLYKPDVLHLQWARDLEFYTFFKTTFNIPIIVSLRGAHINYTPIVEPYIADIYNKTFPEVDAFHAVSHAIGIEAIQYGALQAKTHIIHSPLPLAFFEAYKAPEKNDQKTIRLVSVGRFHWKKGYSYALDTVHQLKQRGYDVNYTIVGPTKLTEELLFKAQQLDIFNQIYLAGHKQQEELLLFLHGFDMMLLPSLEEGIANVVLEAMAIGLPVVSTNCGGMAEVVIPKDTGWLVPVRDPEAMTNAVIEVVHKSKEELSVITQSAHEFVKNEFNSDVSISKFLKLYERVVVKDKSD